MAGGGNSVIKGLMSKVTCDIDPKEVDKMSDEINSDQRRVSNFLVLCENTRKTFLPYNYWLFISFQSHFLPIKLR